MSSDLVKELIHANETGEYNSTLFYRAAERLAFEERQPKPAWTTAAPSQEGWYWVGWHNEGSVPATIVYVWNMVGTNEFYTDKEEMTSVLDYEGANWIGPITQPLPGDPES